jgi:hypothetical protein
MGTKENFEYENANAFDKQIRNQRLRILGISMLTLIMTDSTALILELHGKHTPFTYTLFSALNALTVFGYYNCNLIVDKYNLTFMSKHFINAIAYLSKEQGRPPNPAQEKMIFEIVKEIYKQSGGKESNVSVLKKIQDKIKKTAAI